MERSETESFEIQDNKTEIRRPTRILDARKAIAALTWNWKEHAGRMKDNRWTERVIKWRPRENAKRTNSYKMVR